MREKSNGLSEVNLLLDAGSGDASVVAKLVELGCSPRAVDSMGWSPLMWAASGGHVSIITALLAHGADFKITDDGGRSPLHWAAERGHVEAVDLLVEKLSEQNLDLHGPVSFLQVLTSAVEYIDACCYAGHQHKH